MIWLPKPLYTAKPFVFLLAALSLPLITQNIFVTLFAFTVMGYVAWIVVMRTMWSTMWEPADIPQLEPADITQ